MNIVVFAQLEAESVRPGDVILDVPEPDPSHPAIDTFPAAYRVAEIRDHGDGLTIFARPLTRPDGRRRIWRLAADDLVDVELTGPIAANLLQQIASMAQRADLAPVLLGPSGLTAEEIWDTPHGDTAPEPAEPTMRRGWVPATSIFDQRPWIAAMDRAGRMVMGPELIDHDEEPGSA